VVHAFGRAGEDYTFAKLSPDGSRVIGGTKAGRVTVWNAPTAADKAGFTLSGADGEFGPTARYTPDGRYLVATWSQPSPGRGD
jgi:hypothetical protein